MQCSAHVVDDAATALDGGILRNDAIETLHDGQTCFVAGTLVHTKEGLKAIEEICVGDWVLSYPDDQVPPQRFREQSEYYYRQVTATFSHENEHVCDVVVWDLTNNIKEILKATPNHPIYVKDVGWVPAGDLKFGRVLVSNDFANILVKKKANAGERARVYNIEIDEFHSYYVGNLGAWVHNKGGEPVQLPDLRDVKERQTIYEETNA